MKSNLWVRVGCLTVFFLAIFLPRALVLFPVILCLSLVGLAALKKILWPKLDIVLAVLMTAGLGLMSLSALWSIDPAMTLDRTVSTAGILLTGYGMIMFCAQRLCMDAKFLSILTPVIGSGMIAVGLFFFIEFVTYMPVSHALIDPSMPSYAYNRSMVVFVLWFFPVLFLLQHITIASRKRALMGFALLTVVFLAVFSSQSQTAQVMLLVGLGVYTILMVVQSDALRRKLILLGGGFCTLIILLMPFVFVSLKTDVAPSAPASPFVQSANMGERLEIWQFAAQKITEQPFLGYGVEAMRILKSDTVFSVNKTHTMLHPHNGFLQLWLEMGILGAVLGIAGLWLVILRILKDPALYPVSTACLAAVLCLIGTGYGLWQGWLIALFMCLCAVLSTFRGIPKPVQV